MRKRIGDILLWIHDRVCPCEAEYTELEIDMRNTGVALDQQTKLYKIIYDPHGKT